MWRCNNKTISLIKSSDSQYIWYPFCNLMLEDLKAFQDTICPDWFCHSCFHILEMKNKRHMKCKNLNHCRIYEIIWVLIRQGLGHKKLDLHVQGFIISAKPRNCFCGKASHNWYRSLPPIYLQSKKIHRRSLNSCHDKSENMITTFRLLILIFIKEEIGIKKESELKQSFPTPPPFFVPLCLRREVRTFFFT